MGLLTKLSKAGRTLGGWDVRWIRALIQGVAPGLEHVTLLRHLQPLEVVDIGANRGQFTLAARHASPAALVWAFEPLPQAAAIFSRLFTKDDNVHLFPVAVGCDAGDAIIHVSVRDDSSSLLPITARQDELFPGTVEAGTQTVRVVRLGDCLDAEKLHAPVLLKLDVQGFELSALGGCEDLLQCFHWVYVECSFVELYEGQALAYEVIDYLSQHGFQLSGVYNMTYDKKGIAIQADFLFKQKTSLAG